MSDFVTIDFSRVGLDGPRDEPRRDKMTRSRDDLATKELALPAVNEAAPGVSRYFPPELLEAAKATFTASGGNIAEVARAHDLATTTVTRLAAKHEWPIYGQGNRSVELGRKTRLENLSTVLENRLFQLADAMGVETKEIHDITEKGMGSKFVAPLTQRSSAFSAVFDRYMRVMALLEPELFGQDDDPSNPVAAKIRQRQNQNALGGVDGIDRRMADFAARVAVTALKERDGTGDVIDAEVVDDEAVEE